MNISERGNKSDRLLMVLALGAIVAPVIYAIVVLVLGYLRPGYDHLK